MALLHFWKGLEIVSTTTHAEDLAKQLESFVADGQGKNLKEGLIKFVGDEVTFEWTK